MDRADQTRLPFEAEILNVVPQDRVRIIRVAPNEMDGPPGQLIKDFHAADIAAMNEHVGTDLAKGLQSMAYGEKPSVAV